MHSLDVCTCMHRPAASADPKLAMTVLCKQIRCQHILCHPRTTLPLCHRSATNWPTDPLSLSLFDTSLVLHRRETAYLMTPRRNDPVTDQALPLPLFEALKDRRVILASSSPNRKEAMERMVRPS